MENKLRETLNEGKLSEKPGTMRIAVKGRSNQVTWKNMTFSREASALSYLNQLRRQNKLYDSEPYKEVK